MRKFRNDHDDNKLHFENDHDDNKLHFENDHDDNNLHFENDHDDNNANFSNIFIGLDKRGYPVNIFLISAWKHML